MKRLGTLALLALVLAGCAGRGPQPGADDLLGHWSFTGKMSVRDANEASSFNVAWQQRERRFEVDLSGPLGQGRVEVRGRPGEVVLRRGDDIWRARSLNELGQRLTDLNLPLDHLQYWVRGLPSPWAGSQRQVDDLGRIETLTQGGWQVSFPSYYGEAADALPRRIDFERGSSSGRLVIRNWMNGSP